MTAGGHLGGKGTLTSTPTHTPQPELQTRLRKLIDTAGLTQVSRDLDVGREPLLRYLADVAMQPATFERIERKLAGGKGGPRGFRR